jgi:hypothetical protein
MMLAEASQLPCLIHYRDYPSHAVTFLEFVGLFSSNAGSSS